MAKEKLSTPKYVVGESYDSFRKEVDLWDLVTETPLKSRGGAIALNLPQPLRSTILEKINKKDLAKDDGLATLLAELDKMLGKDELEDVFQKFSDFLLPSFILKR